VKQDHGNDHLVAEGCQTTNKLPFQQQSKEATIVSLDSPRDESSTTEIFTTSNGKFEPSQLDDPNSKHHEKLEKGTSSKSSTASMASSTTEVESSVPTETAEDIATKTSESRKKLENLKALLELAKQKKLAMQGELKQTEGSEAKKNSEEVQAALRRAREKLRGALTSRERALQGMGPVQIPISGLSVSLTIKNISQTGPEDKVYFPAKNFGIDLGRKALEELSSHDSLATRRSQLQQELMALKERLERTQRTTGRDTDDDESKAEDALKEIAANQTPKQVMTKEELERRKEEAQAFMDLSYWKHFVSKQEHIMSEVDGQVNENSKALEECIREIEDTTRYLRETDLQILDLETRQQAVASMVSSATTKLLETRNKLHLEKAKQSTAS
jgi:DNA repair exonuclease SbcCD ATPase subunit